MCESGPTLSPTARAVLRDLLRVFRDEGHDYITVWIENHNGERDPELLAAIRELAGTWLNVASRPATEDDLRGLDIPLTDTSVIVTSAPVLIIEGQLISPDAPDEPGAVTVTLGRVPRDQLEALAALEAEASQ